MTANADTRLRRLPERGSQDLTLACDIIDNARICHVGFTLEEQPYVVPMALGRDGDQVLLHGSVVSRLITNLAAGLPCCVTVTHLDGLVLARSAFNSSMNYRSATVFGTPRLIEDHAEKLRALEIISECTMPGRWDEVRDSHDKEVKMTGVIALQIESASAKVSSIILTQIMINTFANKYNIPSLNKVLTCSLKPAKR